MKKRNIIFFILAILVSSIVGAQNFPRLEVLKIEIVRVLSELKLSPQMGKDNIINFSYEGDAYSLEYYEEGENLYFGSISKYQEYTNEITVAEIKNFNSSYNYKTVKVIDDGLGYCIKSEFFFDDKETLKAMYPQLLSSISRSGKSIKRSASNYNRDSLLIVTSFTPIAVLADSTDISITAHATIETNYPDSYIVGLRVYKNNCLMSFDETNEDFSLLDTLTLQKKNPLVKLSTCVLDNLSLDDKLRYELWHNGQCIASEIVLTKTID